MKPKIICHIMSSVDGRLIPGRWTAPYGGTGSSTLFGEYAAIGKELKTDAWTFGKNTIKDVFPEKFVPKETSGHATAGTVWKGERHSARLFVAIDPEADIAYTSGVLRGDNILVVTDTHATVEYLRFLRGLNISYAVIDDASDITAALGAAVQVTGIESLSVQGGGILNGSLLGCGLLDELSLVIYPGIDGLHGIPSIFECMGENTGLPARNQSLELLSAEQRAHGVVWLRYRFHKY